MHAWLRYMAWCEQDEQHLLTPGHVTQQRVRFRSLCQPCIHQQGACCGVLPSRNSACQPAAPTDARYSQCSFSCSKGQKIGKAPQPSHRQLHTTADEGSRCKASSGAIKIELHALIPLADLSVSVVKADQTGTQVTLLKGPAQQLEAWYTSGPGHSLLC